jgi:hypothetical protein
MKTGGGHWRYDVVWTPSMRHAVVETAIERPTNARRPSSCRRTSLAGERMLACRVVAYNEGGGLNGGHLAYVWDHARVAFVISIHGYGNEARVRAMMAAVVAATGG